MSAGTPTSFSAPEGSDAAQEASFKAVDPGVIPVWRSRNLIRLTVLAVVVGALAPLPLMGAVPDPARWPAAVLGLALLPAALWLCCWRWPQWRFRRLAYCIDDQGIWIRDGVFWRSESALPRIRLQHADVTQGPLERRWQVATLRLYTAGTRHTELRLPGLRDADARALRDRLLAEVAGDAV